MSVAERFWNNPTANSFYGRNKRNTDGMSWKELRAEAKALDIKGYTKMKRPELEEAIINGSK